MKFDNGQLYNVWSVQQCNMHMCVSYLDISCVHQQHHNPMTLWGFVVGCCHKNQHIPSLSARYYHHPTHHSWLPFKARAQASNAAVYDFLASARSSCSLTSGGDKSFRTPSYQVGPLSWKGQENNAKIMEVVCLVVCSSHPKVFPMTS